MKCFFALFTATALAACTQQPATESNAADGNLVVSDLQEPPGNSAPVDGPPAAPPPPPTAGSTPPREVVSEAPFTADSAQGAANVVQTYYALIEAKKYSEALKLWGPNSDLADGTFAARFAGYREYHAEVGKPGPIEGAAGSLYVEVPIRAYGVTTKGERFEEPGVVTLRRVNNVDGSTAEQRRWHIAKVDLPPH